MAGVATNEPLQRVSKENGVFDGALIGAAVSAGGAGAGVFGTRMHHNGIDKRASKHVAAIDEHKNQLSTSIDKIQEKGGRVSPIDRMKERVGQSQVKDINNVRQSKLDNLQDKDKVARTMVDQVNPDVRSQADSARQSAYSNSRQDINVQYDDMVNQSDGNRWVNETSEKRQKNLDVRTEKQQTKLNNLENAKQSWTGNGLQARKDGHTYSRRMGGWKNAAIIGASAVVGSGVGALGDKLNK